MKKVFFHCRILELFGTPTIFQAKFLSNFLWMFLDFTSSSGSLFCLLTPLAHLHWENKELKLFFSCSFLLKILSPFFQRTEALCHKWILLVRNDILCDPRWNLYPLSSLSSWRDLLLSIWKVISVLQNKFYLVGRYWKWPNNIHSPFHEWPRWNYGVQWLYQLVDYKNITFDEN